MTDQKDNRSITEIMQDIKRADDCLVASFGFKMWQQIPKMPKEEREKLGIYFDE